MLTTQESNKKINSLRDMLRDYRKYHRFLGLFLAVFLIISSLTGLLLGWKKNIDLLQPPTQNRLSEESFLWISISDMSAIAAAALDSAQGLGDNSIDRLEVRPEKGVVKVLFTQGYWEVQLEGSTGEVLSVARRHSDWIEKVHDGSIISDGFKLVSMNVLGLGILILTASGFILWYFPKRMRVLKKAGNF